jgi:hypothetical protein
VGQLGARATQAEHTDPEAPELGRQQRSLLLGAAEVRGRLNPQDSQGAGMHDESSRFTMRAMKYRRILGRTGLTVLGLSLVASAVALVGPSGVAARLTSAGFGIGWLFLAYGTGTALAGLPWAWLTPAEHRPRVAGALASRFAASGANAILPVLGIGGDLSRLAWQPPEGRTAGLAGLVVDRLIYAAANGLVLLLLSAFVLVVLPLPVWTTTVGLCGAALLLAVAVSSVFLVSRGRLASRLLGWLKRASRRFAGLPEGAALDGELRRIVGARGALALAMTTHVGARVLLTLEPYAALRALHIQPGLPAVALLAVTPLTLSLVTGFIPSQLGLAEAAQAGMAAALGLDPAIGVALVLLQRLRQIAFVSIAGLLYVTLPARRATPITPDVRRDT